AGQLLLTAADGKLHTRAPARIEARVRELEPEAQDPMSSRGELHASAELGELRAQLDATKARDALDFALDAGARNLSALLPGLPPGWRERARWAEIAAQLRSHGRVEHLGSPNLALREQTELQLEHPTLDDSAARSLALTLASQGDASQQHAQLDVRALGLAIH